MENIDLERARNEDEEDDEDDDEEEEDDDDEDQEESSESSESSESDLEPEPVDIASVNLDALVDRALAEGPTYNGEGAMRELHELSLNYRNRAVLCAHPRLMQLAVDFASHGVEDALVLLAMMARMPSLAREVYLPPGLVEALVRLVEEASPTRLQMSTMELSIESVLLELLHDLDNKVDFVRAGYARRMADVFSTSRHHEVQMWTGSALHACVEKASHLTPGGEMDYDRLREDFFRLPGVMDILLGSEKGEGYVFSLLSNLSECQCITREMLEFPGLVDFVLKRMVGYLMLSQRMQSVLNKLLENCPMQAFEHQPSILSFLVEMMEHGEDFYESLAVQSLASWHVALAMDGRKYSVEEFVPPEEKAAQLVFWRNVPGLWAVISTPRVKLRSPLKRLPIEMFRLLKDTLCGTGFNQE